MKRLNRDPVRFDLFDAFGQFASKHGLSIRDGGAVTKFTDAVRVATEISLDNDVFVYGIRVQSMFETVVAGLGKVRLLKQEDAGDAYADVDIKIPDYRLVLADARQVLVEVKNYRQPTGTEGLEQDVDYIAKLEAYGNLTGAEVFFAVYWYRWNLWTLVPTSVFTRSGSIATLDMSDCFMNNHMGLLGDFLIGTRWPLRLRIEMDEVGRDGDTRSVLVRGVSTYSEDRKIVDSVELHIATMLMFHGQWREEQVVEEHDSRLVAVEYRFAPQEEARKQDSQGFDTNAWISSVISLFFRDRTSRNGEVSGFRVDFTPGEFGKLIPDDYDEKRVALPLWRLHQQPPARSK